MLEQSLSSSPTFWAALYSWFTPTVFFLLLQLVIATIYITSTLANATHKHHHQQDPNFPQQQQLFRSPSVLQRLKSINLYSYQNYNRSQHEQHHTPQPQTYHNEQHHTPQPQTYENEIHVPQLARSPSVLQRLKSINLYSYFPTQPFTTKLENTNVEVKESEENDVLGEIRDNLGGNKEEEGHHVSLEEVFMKLQGQGGNFARTHSDTKPDSGEVPVKLSRKMKKSASNKSAFSHFKEDDIVESRRPATVKEAKAAAMDEDELVDSKADDFINKFKQQLKLQRIDSIMRYKNMVNKGISK
ncbi:pathogen-associated molecular patterns-induced protein A70 [Lathyrus oleraceus]|uniref:DUF4408 domain-containing protein n=1 Tax=Pisum sativum TaxID=3888 RepID=A0A9D4W355_PEA|nr:pathogen-associated molecular patterns-induced protein A70-like [Pisum sativum]KAI5393505.1 hypothetical protein KIW84_060584 [Pisum sativum]